MNDNMENISDFNAWRETDPPYKNRTFRDLNGVFNGSSVVMNEAYSEPQQIGSPDMWPYSLTDYLRNYIGRMVLVRYVRPNGGGCENRGVLKVAGTDFIGILPCRSDALLLLELSAVKSINIIDFRSDNV